MAGLKAKQELGMAPGMTPDKVRKMPKHDFHATAGYTPQEVEALTNAILGALGDTKGMEKRLEFFRTHDVSTTAVETLIEDAFTAVPGQSFYTLKYEGEDDLGEQVEEKIRDIESKFNVAKVVMDLLPDLVYYGHYALRLATTPDGGKVIEIQDSIDIHNLWVLCKGSKVTRVFRRTETQLEALPPENIFVFEVSTAKKRLKSPESFKSETGEVSLPEYFRVPVGLVEPAMPFLIRLRVLEMAILCEDLRRIFSPLVVMVGMPGNITPLDAAEITKKYENDLREMLPTNAALEDISFSELVSLVQRVRVLPSFGEGRGDMKTFTVDTDTTKYVTEIERIRKHIAMVMGYPWYYFSVGADQPEKKQQVIKTQTRYAKKLQALQAKLGYDIRRLYARLLEDEGLKIEEDNLQVEFRSLIDVDMLDSMDYYLTAAECLSKMVDSFSTLQGSGIAPIKYNGEKLVDWMNSLFSMSPGFAGVVELGEEVEEPEPSDGDSSGPSSSGPSSSGPSDEPPSLPPEGDLGPDEPTDEPEGDLGPDEPEPDFQPRGKLEPGIPPKK